MCYGKELQIAFARHNYSVSKLLVRNRMNEYNHIYNASECYYRANLFIRGRHDIIKVSGLLLVAVKERVRQEGGETDRPKLYARLSESLSKVNCMYSYYILRGESLHCLQSLH